MVTLVLPGGSSKNKNWLETTASNIKTDSEVRPVYWGHWNDPNIKFDPKVKANLLDGVTGMRVVDIVAKSVGTLVASYLIQKSPDKIRKVIFCGVPINDLSDNDKKIIKNALNLIPAENILCIQNIEDPHGGTEALKVLLSEFSGKIKIISKEKDDHEYLYQEDFDRFLLE